MSGKETITPQAQSGGEKAHTPEQNIETAAPVYQGDIFSKTTATPPRPSNRQADLWVQRVLNMQHVIGNRAVQRMLTTLYPPVPKPNTNFVPTSLSRIPQPLLQRQVLSQINTQKFDGKPPTYMVWDVIIGGRTPSPFKGTMGAHSTAWVAHIDEVRRYIINVPLETAVQNMILLANEELGEATDLVEGDEPTSLYQLKSQVNPEQQKAVENAKGGVETSIVLLEQALETYNHAIEAQQMDENAPDPNPIPMLKALRSLINSHLTFVNYLPGSTIKGGDPAGHGEGSARGDINAFEYIYALSSRQKKIDDKKEENDKRKIEDKENIDDSKTSEEKPLFENALTSLSNTGMGKLIKDAVKNKFAPDQCGSLIKSLISNLWGLFAAETPDVFAKSHNIDRLQAWRLMVKNFLKTISKAYPYTFDFTKMHEPENQITGLKMALLEAKITLDPNFSKDLYEAIENGALSDESVIREVSDYAEVSSSDIYQSGTGFQSTILLDDNTNQISDVDLIGAVEAIGRTKSPFSGTMGAHSTAWTAHIDGVRRLLTHKSVDDALDALIKKATSAIDDPTLNLSNKISEKHQIFLIGAYNVLKRHINDVTDYKKKDATEKIQLLETIILDYLTFINFLPLSTVETGSVPGGRSEGKHRTFLNSYEDEGIMAIPELQRNQAKKLLQGHLWGLYDPGAISAFPPSLGSREKTNFEKFVGPFKSDHPLHSKINSKVNLSGQKTKIALDRFFHTMLEAYPRSSIDSDLVSSVSEKINQSDIESPIDVVDNTEGEQLRGLLRQNNCLINAINMAANGNDATVTYNQMLDIRLRIGEIGTMLLATPRTINIILEVLGIDRGVTVIYPGNIPAEDFGDAEDDPVMIQHTGYAHFIPYEPPIDIQEEEFLSENNDGIENELDFDDPYGWYNSENEEESESEDETEVQLKKRKERTFNDPGSKRAKRLKLPENNEDF